MVPYDKENRGTVVLAHQKKALEVELCYELECSTTIFNIRQFHGVHCF